MSTAIVHIGLHKTGTTSFQEWLTRNAEALATCGTRPHLGMFVRGHIELPQLVLRPSLLVPARTIAPDSALPEVQEMARRHVRATVDAPEDVVVFSAEALSWSRTAEEVDALADLLAPRSVHAVAVFREKAAFLESYRHQFVMQQGRHERPLAASSFMNTEPDSWVVDYDAIRRLWGGHPRIASFTQIDYDSRVADEGSVLPALVRAIGLDPPSAPGTDGIWQNARTPPAEGGSAN